MIFLIFIILISATVYTYYKKPRTKNMASSSNSTPSSALRHIEESIFSCAICMIEYNEGELKPRSLPCGHSYCSVCLIQIKKIHNCCCPECKTSFDRLILPPVNFSLLRAMRDKKSLPQERKTLTRKSASTLKLMESYDKKIKKQKLKLISDIKNLEAKEQKIKDWKSFLSAIPVAMKEDALLVVQEMIEQWSLNKKERTSVILPTEKATSTQTVQNIDLNSRSMLIPVLLKTRKEGKVIAKSYYNEETYYGRITEGETKLHVHALQSDNLHLDALYTINLNYLQDFLDDDDLTVFLDFKWKDKRNSEQGGRVYIKLGNRSLAKQFFYLCNGERGISYKGSQFTTSQENLIQASIVNSISKNNDIMKNVDYEEKAESYCYEGYLFGTTNCSLFLAADKIQKYLPYHIGCVTQGIDILKEALNQKGEIEDCGFEITSGLKYSH